MKGKLSFMWRATLALVLVLSLGVVMAVPVSADVSQPTVTVDPALQNVAAEYTIVFTITNTLILGKTITVDFPTGTTVPATGTYSDGDITVQGTNVTGVDVTVATRAVTFMIPLGITGGTEVTVVFTTAAGITNPTAADDLTLTVETEVETDAVTSATYDILALPVVSAVQPVKGNVGDTMWVEVAGSSFTGTAATNVSTTTLDFGDDITVVSTMYIGTGEIDCQITINTAGAATVTATTAVGTSTEATSFTAYAAGTPQVDVWTKYTPADTTFVADTLVFDATTDTITAGIATADAGSSGAPQVLIVHADTYAENLDVNQNYVTIKSLSGATTTIIDGSGGDWGVTLGGTELTIEDLTINRGGTVGGIAGVKLCHINATLVGDDFTIKGCTFSDWGGTGDQWNTGKNDAVIGGWQCGLFTTAVVTGLIEGNTFSGNSRTAIWLQSSGGSLKDITIKDNIFSGCIETSNGHGIRLEGDIGVTTAAVIDGNTISNMSGTGIILRGSTTDAEATITDNTISGCYNGIDTTAVWVLTITENTITGSDENGIKIQDGAEGAKTIKYNDISGNTGTVLIDDVPRSVYGLNNEDADHTYVAKYNWWGAIGGPSADADATTPSTALGQGDVVAVVAGGGVTYDPWLTETQSTTVTDGIAYHGSTMVLQPSWNTLSVPLKLKDSANTLTEIAALGDFLTATNWETAYQYNPATPGWETPTELVPGRGYYIKILGTADVSFPVLYSGQLGLPTYDLTTTGWNLIGSMFGIDESNGYGIAAASDAADGQMIVTDALDSIKANTSVVVSPYLPGQVEAFGTDSGEGTLTMKTGEGYWVFMETTDTLAGFEVTPIYKLFLP